MNEIPDYLDGVFNFEHFGAFLPVFTQSLGEKGFHGEKILNTMFCACNIFRRQIYINFPIFQVGCTTFLGFGGFSSSEWFKRVQNGHLGAISGSSGTELVEQCGTRVEQVRAHSGRCIGAISQVSNGNQRVPEAPNRAQKDPKCPF